MATNREKIDMYIDMIENLLETQSPDMERFQELAREHDYAVCLQDYSEEEIGDDRWFQEHVLKELD